MLPYRSMLKCFSHFLAGKKPSALSYPLIVSFVSLTSEIIYKNSSDPSPSPSSQTHTLVFPSVDFIISPFHIPVFSPRRSSCKATMDWDLAAFFILLTGCFLVSFRQGTTPNLQGKQTRSANLEAGRWDQLLDCRLVGVEHLPNL